MACRPPTHDRATQPRTLDIQSMRVTPPAEFPVILAGASRFGGRPTSASRSRHLTTRGSRGPVRWWKGGTVTATEVSDGVRSDSWRWASAELPYIYEINTWPWLNQLSVEAGRPVDLSTVPDERWAALADAGFDAVWLMGVWARSPAGSAIALDNKELVQSFQAVLPDYRPRRRRRVAVLRPRLRGRPAPGRTRRPGPRPRRAGPARTGPHPRLRPQPCRTRPSVDAHEPGALRPGHQPGARGRSGILRRDRRLGAGQRSGPVLPGLAGRRAAQRVRPRPARRPSSTPSATSPNSATECGATWRC